MANRKPEPIEVLREKLVSSFRRYESAREEFRRKQFDADTNRLYAQGRDYASGPQEPFDAAAKVARGEFEEAKEEFKDMIGRYLRMECKGKIHVCMNGSFYSAQSCFEIRLEDVSFVSI